MGKGTPEQRSQPILGKPSVLYGAFRSPKPAVSRFSKVGPPFAQGGANGTPSTVPADASDLHGTGVACVFEIISRINGGEARVGLTLLALHAGDTAPATGKEMEEAAAKRVLQSPISQIRNFGSQA